MMIFKTCIFTNSCTKGRELLQTDDIIIHENSLLLLVINTTLEIHKSNPERQAQKQEIIQIITTVLTNTAYLGIQADRYQIFITLNTEP